MSAKEKAMEIYNANLALASTDGRSFRKTVMDAIMSDIGCSLAAAATYYNNCKKAVPVEGLGRPVASKGVQRAGGKGKKDELVADNECFTVIELVPSGDGYNVGRCQSFLIQGDASEKFDEKASYTPMNPWVMIQGLGPLSGEAYKLGAGEEEIKRYSPTKDEVTA